MMEMVKTGIKTGFKIGEVLNIGGFLKNQMFSNIIKCIPKLIPDFDPDAKLNITDYNVNPLTGIFELEFTATDRCGFTLWFIKTTGNLNNREIAVSISKDKVVWHKITYSIELVEQLIQA